MSKSSNAGLSIVEHDSDAAPEPHGDKDVVPDPDS